MPLFLWEFHQNDIGVWDGSGNGNENSSFDEDPEPLHEPHEPKRGTEDPPTPVRFWPWHLSRIKPIKPTHKSEFKIIENWRENLTYENCNFHIWVLFWTRSDTNWWWRLCSKPKKLFFQKMKMHIAFKFFKTWVNAVRFIFIDVILDYRVFHFPFWFCNKRPPRINPVPRMAPALTNPISALLKPRLRVPRW